MHGRGNYVTPVGQGSYASIPSFHHRPHAPPPPPPSQMSQPPRMTVSQSGPLPLSSHIGQMGHHVFQNVLPGPPQHVPFSTVSSSGINPQSYFAPAPLPPPPTIPPLPLSRSYGSSGLQQHPQWTQTPHFMSPAGPALTMVHQPSPSLGQTLYRGQLNQQTCLLPNMPSIRLPPPPPLPQLSQPPNMPAIRLPPPPPPPQPPPPPPPLPSSRPGSPPLPPSPCAVSHETGASASPHPKLGEIPSDSVGAVLASNSGADQVSKNGGYLKCEENGSKTVSENVKSVLLDLSSPPPRPTDARILHNIEFVCHSIAKNGLQYEDMIRQKEFGNPEFSFLSRDERGTETSIAHKYFLWMKKKLQLIGEELKESDSIEREKETSAPHSKICIPNSPVDSDMDMEDDITHPDGAVTSSFTYQRHGIVAASNEVDGNDLHMSNGSEEHILDKHVLDENFVSSESSALVGRQGPATSSNADHVAMQISFAKADDSVRNSLAEVGSVFDSVTCDLSSQHTDFIPQSASTDVEDSSSEKLTGRLVKEASPFRLLQDYASDGSSDHEPRHGDIFGVAVVQTIDKGSPTLDAGVMDVGSEGSLKSNESHEAPKESCINQRIFTSDIDISSISKKNEDFVQKVHSNQDSTIHGSCHQGLEEINVQKESRSTFDIKEDSKSMAGLPKVDEFGRLVREGGSESDSEGSPRYTRPRGKRERSRSRSRSPHDRRRRSPWRRKNGRGRSRSLSPKRRRSRSRSPPHWLIGDKIRREKGAAAECFNFLQGKCYRGALCRYMHHEDKMEKSRSYRSKMQRQNLSLGSRTSDFSEKIETSGKKIHHDDEGGFKELNTPKDRLYSQENRVLEESDRCLPKEHDHSEQGVVPTSEIDKDRLQTVAACSTLSAKNSEPEEPEEQICTPVVESVDVHYAEMHSAVSQSANCSSVSALIQPFDKPPNLDSSDNPKSGFNTLNKSVSSETLQSQAVEPVPPVSASDLSHKQPPSFSSVVEETHASYTKQSLRDSNLELPLPNYPSNGLSMYQASVSYGHARCPPPIPFWNSLPPPPAHIPAPYPMLGISTTASLVHGQYDSHVPVQDLAQLPSMDFSTQNTLRPYTTDSSNIGLPQVYPSRQGLNEAAHPWDGLQPKTIHGNQAMSHPRAGFEMAGGQCFSGRVLPDLYPSSSISQENLVFKGVTSSKEPFSSEVRAHSDERAAPADGVPSLFGEDGKVGTSFSRYTSGLLNRNQPSRFSDFGASRIVSHFNPYASTFDRPLSYEMDRQYGSRYGTSFGLNQPAVSGGGIASVRSNNFISPQSSAQAVQGILRISGGDQYDPLNDSLEPFSNSARKSDHGQKYENTDESDSRFRSSGLNMPLDLDKNSKKAASGAVPVLEPLENEEYGETAEAKVGGIENESSSNLNDPADDAVAEETEIDQVNGPGKKKKSKESRSMRQFKVALAGFVKEVLKPSWRQGNMSKEAFKTIVKKTVDKVAGAMKSGHVPKSQEKINRFIDSSQRKLTKLVMGRKGFLIVF